MRIFFVATFILSLACSVIPDDAAEDIPKSSKISGMSIFKDGNEIQFDFQYTDQKINYNWRDTSGDIFGMKGENISSTQITLDNSNKPQYIRQYTPNSEVALEFFMQYNSENYPAYIRLSVPGKYIKIADFYYSNSELDSVLVTETAESGESKNHKLYFRYNSASNITCYYWDGSIMGGGEVNHDFITMIYFTDYDPETLPHYSEIEEVLTGCFNPFYTSIPINNPEKLIIATVELKEGLGGRMDIIDGYSEYFRLYEGFYEYQELGDHIDIGLAVEKHHYFNHLEQIRMNSSEWSGGVDGKYNLTINPLLLGFNEPEYDGIFEVYSLLFWDISIGEYLRSNEEYFTPSTLRYQYHYEVQ